MLFDATRDFGEQSRRLRRLDAVLITHAHRDAAGGIPALAQWLGDRAPVWDVRRIRLTQIGRSAPRHEELSRAVRLLCGRARPAYNGLVERLRR